MVISTHFYRILFSSLSLCISRINHEIPGGCEIPCTCHYCCDIVLRRVVNHEALVGEEARNSGTCCVYTCMYSYSCMYYCYLTSHGFHWPLWFTMHGTW